MISLKAQYEELVALTQLYLLRECSSQTMVAVSPDHLLHYRARTSAKEATPKRALALPQPIAPLVVAAKTPVQNNRIDSPTPSSIQACTGPVPLDKQTIQTSPVNTPPAPMIQLPISPAEVTTPNKRTLALFPLDTPAAVGDFNPFWKLFRTHFPQIPLHEAIPDDKAAKKAKQRWQAEHSIPPVIILSFEEGEKSLAFLKNIAQAISLRLTPARVISALRVEKEKKWDQLLKAQGVQLIIASDYGLYLQPQLMHYYQEKPQEGKHTLNQIPLLLLSDLNFYFKNGKMKAYLWRAICTEFAAMKTKL